MKLYNRLEYKKLRKKLRKNSTDSERELWSIVRNRQIRGLKFFRQYSVENFILDCYCPKLKLAIEIDGGQHSEPENAKKDRTRTEYLTSLNIKVLRFWNNDVLENIDGVYAKIVSAVDELLLASSLVKEEE